ncbi:MAG: hypothetical protein Q3976_09955 [Corynebacterium sp.]|nr:hypothetical protein [Corynebacterium sp.]
MDTLVGHLRAELLRWNKSSTAYFSLIGLIFGALSILLAQATRAAGFESAAYNWQVMYFTGIAAPMMMIVAALQESRDKKARLAGVLWKGSNPRYEQLARLFGAAITAFLFQILSFGSVIIFSHGPLKEGLIGIIYSWFGALGYLGLGAIIARYAGMVGALLGGFGWQIVGGFFAEGSFWWANPAAWPIRILLEPIGVNFNGTPIDPSNPVLEDPPFLGVFLCLVFAVFVWGVAVLTASHRQFHFDLRRSQRKTSEANSVEPELENSAVHSSRVASYDFTQRPEGHTSISRLPLPGIGLALRGSGIIPAVVITLLLIAGLSFTYSYETVEQVITFGFFSVGVGLLPILCWRVFEPGYVVTYLHNQRIVPALIAFQMMVILILVMVSGICLSVTGMPIAELFRHVLLWFLVGTGLCSIALGLTIRLGPGATIGLTVLWTVVALTLGGDVLADTFLWVPAIPAWPHTGASTERIAYAAPLSIVLMCIGLWFAGKELARYRRNC